MCVHLSAMPAPQLRTGSGWEVHRNMTQCDPHIANYLAEKMKLKRKVQLENMSQHILK